MSKIQDLKKEIIAIGRLLWDKDLVAASSGNVSLRIDKNNILITAHNRSLGFLSEEDIIKIDSKGKSNKEKMATMEKPAHLYIHKHFPHAAIIHAHPPFTTGYFSVRKNLNCITFESQLILGNVACVNQDEATMTNFASIVSALKKSSIVVLKKHGVVAIANSLEEAFFRIQLLEEAVKINLISKIFSKK